MSEPTDTDEPHIYSCPACHRIGTRAGFSTHSRQGFMVCPSCLERGLESFPEDERGLRISEATEAEHRECLEGMFSDGPNTDLGASGISAIGWAIAELNRLRARVAELEDGVARLMPPPADPSTFEHELAVYAAHKEQWLAEGLEGKYAVIKGDSGFSGFTTYNEALSYGYNAYGLTPFMVRKILAVEPVLYMRPG